MLKIGIYDPYLDTLGGGERYILTIAEYYSQKDDQVDLFWSGKNDLLAKATDRFSLNLNKVNIVDDIFKIPQQSLSLFDDLSTIKSPGKEHVRQTNPLNSLKMLINRFMVMSKYDIFFFLSDGSVPFLFSKKNFLHFQVPFSFEFNFKTKLLNSLKLKLINNNICNSKFTESFVRKYYTNNTKVLYPPVDIDKFTASNNKNIILSVGRFDNILNAKKQDILIEAFRVLNQNIKGWKLILAGGSLEDPSKNKYLLYLNQLAKDLPVEFMVNPKFPDLKELYATSKIYWHAAGFNVDQNLHPEETEHFGISTVEAMASGLVPLVVNRGGLPEIISDGINGFLWEDITKLYQKTKQLIDNPKKLSELSDNAKNSISKFSKENFNLHLDKILNNI